MVALDIAPLTPSIGAVMNGIDLAHDLQDLAVDAAMKQSLLDHQVLVFRDRELTQEQHKDFGRRIGERVTVASTIAPSRVSRRV